MSARVSPRRLRVVHVGFHADAQRRDARTLLRAWPTLAGVATAAARAGVDVTVVQAAASPEIVRQDDVAFHFVDDARGMPGHLAGGLRVPRRPTRLLARVAALAPDVVHVHGLHYPLAVRQLTRALGATPT